MGEETPESQEPDISEQEELETQDLEIFRWNSLVAPPWDAGTYYFFLMPDPAFYEAKWLGYTLDFAKNFHLAMAHFSSAASYAGLHKTIERIGNELTLQGNETGEAMLLATIGAQLIQRAVTQFLPDFTHVLIHALDDAENSNSFLYPTSPMHLWAFGQACEYLEKDLLPIFEFKDGSSSYPYGEIAEIKQASQAALQFLSVSINDFIGKVNPYKQITDLRALGELADKPSQSPP